MLVKFNSSVSGEMLMLAPAAKCLLEIVGKTCSARGVITAEQLPDALLRLRNAVALDKPAHQEAVAAALLVPDGGDKPAKDAPVSLTQRAYPFIEMLEWTQREDGYVLWEAEKDF